uniref:Uncharacterized protein n=1 Tax=Alexandrium andersonii TaxID=327968 RepID=A0A7S2D7K4_9DINO|mmetsp:Transcript_48727/g.110367  ORF Transcript_48727/g.110367 Transcript_48727/m.110367 type:complete len:117 (+) Transcript_48727:82-432(+)
MGATFGLEGTPCCGTREQHIANKGDDSPMPPPPSPRVEDCGPPVAAVAATAQPLQAAAATPEATGNRGHGQEAAVYEASQVAIAHLEACPAAEKARAWARCEETWAAALRAREAGA